MTAVAIEPEPVPLAKDAAGQLMVKGTRVPLGLHRRAGTGPALRSRSGSSLTVRQRVCARSCWPGWTRDCPGPQQPDRLGAGCQIRLRWSGGPSFPHPRRPAWSTLKPARSGRLAPRQQARCRTKTRQPERCRDIRNHRLRVRILPEVAGSNPAPATTFRLGSLWGTEPESI